MGETSVISRSLLSERRVVRTPGGEWGSFYLSAWQNQRHDGIHYGGEIVANTTFGMYGHYWNACGVPFKTFLCDLEFDYFMTKAATRYKEFAFEDSLANIRKAVLDDRRRGEIDKATAAAIWEGFEDIRADGDGGPHKFVSDLYDIPELRKVTQEPYEFIRERATADCLGFWRELWPLLVAELKQSIPATAAVAG